MSTLPEVRGGLALTLCGAAILTLHTAVASIPAPADEALLSAALLKLTDLPPGWRKGPASKPPDYSRFRAPCRQLTSALKLRVAHGSSGSFAQGATAVAYQPAVPTRPPNEQVGESVAVMRAPADATTLMAASHDNQFTTCAKKILSAGVANLTSRAGAKSTVTLGRLSVAQIGDDSFGYEAVLQVSQNGVSATAYDDLVFFRIGRVAISFTSLRAGTSPSGDFDAEFRAVAARVQAAEGTTP